MSISKATEYFYIRGSSISTDANVYSNLANGDVMQAFEDAEDARLDFEQKGSPADKAAAAISRAEVALACDEVDQASHLAEDALRQAKAASNDKLQASATNVLAKATLQNSAQDAVAKARDALALAKASNDRYVAACVQHTLAKALQQSGKGAEALVTAHDIANSFAGFDAVAEGCALICAAELQTGNGDHRGALNTAKKAADILAKAGNAAKQGLALARAASAGLLTAGTSAEGFDIADKALGLLDKAGEIRVVIPLKLDMCRGKLSSEAYVEAEDLAEEAQAAAKKIGDLAQEAASAQLLATVRLAIAVEDSKEKDETDTVSATEAARDALSLFRKLGDRRGEASAMQKLAQVRYQAGARDMAKMAAEESQTLFKEIGDAQGEAGAVLLIAHVMHTDEQLDGAKRFATKAYALYQSVEDSEGMESCNGFLDKLKATQAEKTRTEKAEKQTVSDTGLVKLVNSVDESSHLLSYFADMNEEEDTELGEFDLKAWGGAMSTLKIQA